MVPSLPPASVAMVVPTYNERDRLADLVSAIFAAYAAEGVDGELIIVDDNSPDGTGALAEELATRHRITVVHRGGEQDESERSDGLPGTAARTPAVHRRASKAPADVPAAHGRRAASRQRSAILRVASPLPLDCR